jgi:fido (protein-threonine AMPylation protein)
MIKKGDMSSSSIFDELVNSGEQVSLVTIKRDLSAMVSVGVLLISGSGRLISYSVSALGRIFFDVDPREYCSIEPDRRYGKHQYDFDLIKSMPDSIFDDKELNHFSILTEKYKTRSNNLSPTIMRKELERFVIELSWKSSKIEGNTYTLLDTEKLILENKKASGKTEEETQMILNHKSAFDYIHNNPEYFKTITKKKIEDLHAILVQDMGINTGLRKNMIGITGSTYKPIDNIYQISDALEILVAKILEMKDPYTKALISLLGISYIQPFEDGNKRTGRFLANALLLAYGLPPLSYRSVSIEEYREAILVFYELNSIMPFKKIFISQYEFTIENYTII